MILALTRASAPLVLIAVLAAAAACGSDAAPPAPVPEPTNVADGGPVPPGPQPLDAGTPRTADAGSPGVCDEDDPFASVQRISALSLASGERRATLTGDELEIVFEGRAAAGAPLQLFAATRGKATDSWGAPAADGVTAAVNGGPRDVKEPSVTPDGLTLVFMSKTAAGDATQSLMRSTRGSVAVAFAAPEAIVSPFYNGVTIGQPFLLAAPGNLYMRTGEGRLAVADRFGAGFGAPVPLAIPAPAPSGRLGSPVVNRDETRVYFAQSQGVTVDDADIAVVTRASTGVPFGNPTKLGAPVNVPGAADAPDWLSPDRCRLYLTSGRDGTEGHLYVATRAPRN